MNIKKIGLTALAGSLVATSAFAGEMSVAGGASITVEHKNGTAADSGKSYTMGNQLTFSGSGELDNGLNVSLSFAVKKFKCDTDPWLVVIVDQTSSVSLLYFWSIFFKYLFLTLKEPESVLCV